MPGERDEKAVRIEDYAHNIGALIPFYDEQGGNSTRVYTLDGDTVEDSRTMRWILKKLAQHFAVDLESLRKRFGSYLGVTRGVPLPLREELVLIPFKFRKIIGDNDGAGGYVNLKAVERVEDFPAGDGLKSRIILRHNYVVPCYYSRKTVEQRLRAGELVSDKYKYSLRPYPDIKSFDGKAGELKINPDMLKIILDLMIHSFNLPG